MAQFATGTESRTRFARCQGRRRHRLPLYTFDRRFARIAAGEGLVVEVP